MAWIPGSALLLTCVQPQLFLFTSMGLDFPQMYSIPEVQLSTSAKMVF